MRSQYEWVLRLYLNIASVISIMTDDTLDSAHQALD